MRNFKVGDIVKYATPQNDSESEARFIVKEISPAIEIIPGKPERGMIAEKTTVEYICDMTFKPTSCYFSTEFTKA